MLFPCKKLPFIKLLPCVWSSSSTTHTTVGATLCCQTSRICRERRGKKIGDLVCRVCLADEQLLGNLIVSLSYPLRICYGFLIRCFRHLSSISWQWIWCHPTGAWKLTCAEYIIYKSCITCHCNGDNEGPETGVFVVFHVFIVWVSTVQLSSCPTSVAHTTKTSVQVPATSFTGETWLDVCESASSDTTSWTRCYTGPLQLSNKPHPTTELVLAQNSLMVNLSVWWQLSIYGHALGVLNEYGQISRNKICSIQSEMDAVCPKKMRFWSGSFPIFYKAYIIFWTQLRKPAI